MKDKKCNFWSTLENHKKSGIYKHGNKLCQLLIEEKLEIMKKIIVTRIYM